MVAPLGPLLFVAVDRLFQELEDVPEGKTLVLDLSAVPAMDESGALMISRVAQRMHDKGGRLYLVGLDRELLRLLLRMGVVNDVGRRRICRTMDGALLRAMRELKASQRSSDGVQ